MTQRNYVEASGCLLASPVYSHSCAGQDFFRAQMRCPRLSGTVDLLPLVFPRTLLPSLPEPGLAFSAVGEIRSHNNAAGAERRLELYFYVQCVGPAPQAPCNRLTLYGIICKPPVHRFTPAGKEITDLLLAAPRARPTRSDYLPCIAWSRTAARTAAMPVGQPLWVSGRFQSRFYQKTVGETSQQRIAYEISIQSIALTTCDEKLSYLSKNYI